MTETKIIIGGDLCPVHRNAELFCKGDARGLFNDLLEELETADLVVANLECPLIGQPTPILKSGPVLAGPTEAIHGIARSRIRCLGLANNHTLDHGAAGLENTLRAAAEAGIQTFGAGRNLADAGKMLVTTAGSLRIGVLGATEQEWSIATAHSPGANPLDIVDCARTLKGLRDTVDFSIVLLHDGMEYYLFPSPRLQKICRFLIEQGADMVVCQHSHCAGAYETYGKGHIVYGQGNLIFDSPDHNGTWNQGFLIRLAITPNRTVRWQPIAYTQSSPAPGARRMGPAQERIFLEELAGRSEAIKDEGFVARTWEQFCHDQRHGVMNFILGHGRLLGRLNQNGWVVRHVHGKQRLREIRNCVGSDTNRELLLGALNQCLREN